MTDTISKPRIAAMFGGDRVSFVLGGRFRSLLNGSDAGRRVIEELKKEDQDLDLIAELSDVALYVAKRSSGRVVVDDRDQLRLDDKVVDYGLAGRILAVLHQGFDFDALSRFIEKVAENPDPAVAADLFRFLEKGNMPLTPNGNFLAFKKVDDNLWSYNSGPKGKVQYPLNSFVSEPRDECNSNPAQTCSRGLHVCSHEYLGFWYAKKGRVLICEVNPRDVVSVPRDHNDQKLRTCQLYVSGEIPEADAVTHFNKAVDDRYPNVDHIAIGTNVGAIQGNADAWSDRFPESLSEVQISALGKTYVDAYADAYETAYTETYSRLWTVDRATLEARVAGAAQADADYPRYDNDSADSPRRAPSDELVTWVERAFPELVEPETHEVVVAFDRAYRDAYHTQFQSHY